MTIGTGTLFFRELKCIFESGMSYCSNLIVAMKYMVKRTPHMLINIYRSWLEALIHVQRFIYVKFTTLTTVL